MSWTSPQPDEPPRDVLAAEAFAVPGSDPELQYQGPVVPPADPAGIEEAHDVLAADEFPMPAGSRTGQGRAAALTQAAQDSWRLGLLALAGALAAVVLLRTLRRR